MRARKKDEKQERIYLSGSPTFFKRMMKKNFRNARRRLRVFQVILHPLEKKLKLHRRRVFAVFTSRRLFRQEYFFFALISLVLLIFDNAEEDNAEF